MKYIDLRKEYPHLDSTYAAYPVSYNSRNTGWLNRLWRSAELAMVM